MPIYLCDDGNAEIEITADSAQEAAQEYVDGGSWGDDSETFMIDVYVQELPEHGADELEICRSDLGDGGWSLHIPDDDTDAGLLLSGESDRDASGIGWSRPNDEDREEAMQVYRDRFDRECITITVEPNEPECEAGQDHDWQSPHDVVGGLEENPGVQGHGGGVIIREVCAHCGCYRVTDTWASHGAQQGFESVRYEDADDDSLAWVAASIDD